jgi:hypothetical protein
LEPEKRKPARLTIDTDQHAGENAGALVGTPLPQVLGAGAGNDNVKVLDAFGQRKADSSNDSVLSPVDIKVAFIAETSRMGLAKPSHSSSMRERPSQPPMPEFHRSASSRSNSNSGKLGLSLAFQPAGDNTSEQSGVTVDAAIDLAPVEQGHRSVNTEDVGVAVAIQEVEAAKVPATTSSPSASDRSAVPPRPQMVFNRSNSAGSVKSTQVVNDNDGSDVWVARPPSPVVGEEPGALVDKVFPPSAPDKVAVPPRPQMVFKRSNSAGTVKSAQEANDNDSSDMWVARPPSPVVGDSGSVEPAAVDKMSPKAALGGVTSPGVSNSTAASDRNSSPSKEISPLLSNVPKFRAESPRTVQLRRIGSSDMATMEASLVKSSSSKDSYNAVHPLGSGSGSYKDLSSLRNSISPTSSSSAFEISSIASSSPGVELAAGNVDSVAGLQNTSMKRPPMTPKTAAKSAFEISSGSKLFFDCSAANTLGNAGIKSTDQGSILIANRETPPPAIDILAAKISSLDSSFQKSSDSGSDMKASEDSPMSGFEGSGSKSLDDGSVINKSPKVPPAVSAFAITSAKSPRANTPKKSAFGFSTLVVPASPKSAFEISSPKVSFDTSPTRNDGIANGLETPKSAFEVSSMSSGSSVSLSHSSAFAIMSAKSPKPTPPKSAFDFAMLPPKSPKHAEIPTDVDNASIRSEGVASSRDELTPNPSETEPMLLMQTPAAETICTDGHTASAATAQVASPTRPTESPVFSKLAQSSTLSLDSSNSSSKSPGSDVQRSLSTGAAETEVSITRNSGEQADSVVGASSGTEEEVIKVNFVPETARGALSLTVSSAKSQASGERPLAPPRPGFAPRSQPAKPAQLTAAAPTASDDSATYYPVGSASPVKVVVPSQVHADASPTAHVAFKKPVATDDSLYVAPSASSSTDVGSLVSSWTASISSSVDILVVGSMDTDVSFVSASEETSMSARKSGEESDRSLSREDSPRVATVVIDNSNDQEPAASVMGAVVDVVVTAMVQDKEIDCDCDASGDSAQTAKKEHASQATSTAGAAVQPALTENHKAEDQEENVMTKPGSQDIPKIRKAIPPNVAQKLIVTDSGYAAQSETQNISPSKKYMNPFDDPVNLVHAEASSSAKSTSSALAAQVQQVSPSPLAPVSLTKDFNAAKSGAQIGKPGSSDSNLTVVTTKTQISKNGSSESAIIAPSSSNDGLGKDFVSVSSTLSVDTSVCVSSTLSLDVSVAAVQSGDYDVSQSQSGDGLNAKSTDSSSSAAGAPKFKTVPGRRASTKEPNAAPTGSSSTVNDHPIRRMPAPVNADPNSGRIGYKSASAATSSVRPPSTEPSSSAASKSSGTASDVGSVGNTNISMKSVPALAGSLVVPAPPVAPATLKFSSAGDKDVETDPASSMTTAAAPSQPRQFAAVPARPNRNSYGGSSTSSTGSVSGSYSYVPRPTSVQSQTQQPDVKRTVPVSAASQSESSATENTSSNPLEPTAPTVVGKKSVLSRYDPSVAPTNFAAPPPVGGATYVSPRPAAEPQVPKKTVSAVYNPSAAPTTFAAPVAVTTSAPGNAQSQTARRVSTSSYDPSIRAATFAAPVPVSPRNATAAATAPPASGFVDLKAQPKWQCVGGKWLRI